MDDLPTELLEKVFYSLHQKDKVECLLVCRAWKQVLENTVLFTTIRLQNKLQLDKLVSKIHRDPSKSNHIERLILEIKDIESTGIDILGFLFFNIHELEFYGSANNDYNIRFTKALSFHSWSKSIRRIIEPSNNVFTIHILRKSLYPVLSEISICGKESQSGEEPTILLANAPALKCLSLQNYSLSLMNLEFLHDKLPLLSSLSLCEIKIDSDILPTEIEPAKRMMKLFLKGVQTSSADNYIVFQKYMTKKYSKLVSILYLVSVDSGDLGNSCQLKELTIGDSMIESQINGIAGSKQTRFIEKLSLHSTPDNIYQILLSKLSVLTVLSINHNTGSQATEKVDVNRLLDSLGNNISALEMTYANLLLDISCFKM